MNVAIHAPGASLDVSVDGVVVGQITLNASGNVRLKFASFPDDGNELPSPEPSDEKYEGVNVPVRMSPTATVEFSPTSQEVPSRIPGSSSSKGMYVSCCEKTFGMSC